MLLPPEHQNAPVNRHNRRYLPAQSEVKRGETTVTYVSRPVRYVRSNPTEGEIVSLLLRVADDGDGDAIADAVRDNGGVVHDRLRFQTIAVTIPEVAVDRICSLDGLEAVETDGTIDLTAGDPAEGSPPLDSATETDRIEEDPPAR